MNNDIKRFYDITAQKTADEWYQIEILKPTIIDFISLLPPNPRILDFGCGPGHESMRLAGAGADVVGIDFSEECIKTARKRCPRCEFRVMDFRFVDYELGKFNGVFACASLIHISPEELCGVLKNIKHLLTKDGYTAIIILDGEGINKKWSLMEAGGEKLNRTVYMYTKEYLINEAQKVGFKFVREGFIDEALSQYGWRNYIFETTG